MAERVTSAQLVGRAEELGRLTAALDAALDGRPQVRLVAGEAGVGKTRLLDELAAVAAGRGARMLRGDCVALGDGEIAYAPITAALRPLVRAQDPAFDAVSAPARRALEGLLPGLAPAAEHGGGDRADRSQLFEALLELLRVLADDGGLVLVLEDLHWADAVTRDLVRFLASALTDERLVLVGSLRDDEVGGDHPLRELLAELERRSGGQARITVPPLTPAEVRAQAEAIAGPAGTALAERLWERAQGNPLFVEELLAVGTDALPPTLREALLLRTERLSAGAQELVRLVAIGGRVGHGLLATVSGLGPGPLRAALRETVDARVLAVDDERYGLRHALLREAVRADLLPGEAADLHRRFAAAVEASGRRAPEDLLALANHYAGTDDDTAILRSAVAAGLAGRDVFAFEAAVAHYERALERWERVPDPEAVAELEHTRLLILTADAHRRTDSPVRAAELLQRAADGVDAEADPLLAASALEKLADRRWALGECDAASAARDRALTLLDRSVRPEPLIERATLLATEAKEHSRSGSWAKALPVAREALEEARACGDRDAEVRAHDALGLTLVAIGEHDEGLGLLRAGAELAAREPLGDGSFRDQVLPMTMLVSFELLAEAAAMAGRLALGRDTVAEAQARERALGHRSRSLARLGVRLALLTGDVEVARAALPTPARSSMGMAFVVDCLCRAELALTDGDDAAAREVLDAVAAQVVVPHRPPILGRYTAARVELERRTGDLPAARAAVDTALARLDAESREPAATALVAAAGALLEADAPAGGDATRAATLAARAAAAAGDAPAPSPDRGPSGDPAPDRTPSGDLARRHPVESAHAKDAAAAAARAAGADEAATWSAVAAAWDALGYGPAAGRAQLHAAEAALAAGDRHGAAALASAAQGRAAAMGTAWLLEAIEAVLERGGLDAAGAAGENPFDLTDRERQVLALLVAGRRNREIGDELFMAEKTASVHVSRILAKLGVRTRTEAAAMALRLDLA